MSNIKQEIIWYNTTIKGTEKIETISQEVVQVPDYQYGLSQNTLNANIALRNVSSWWNYYASHTTFATTWVKTISWVWFIPKHIKFIAFISWTNQWGSDGYYNNGNVYCRYTYVTGWNSVYWWVGYSIYCYSQYSWWNVSIATTVTPIADWFTINVTNVSWWAISLLYECFA